MISPRFDLVVFLAKVALFAPSPGLSGNGLLTRHRHSEPFFGRNQIVEIICGFIDVDLDQP